MASVISVPIAVLVKRPDERGPVMGLVLTVERYPGRARLSAYRRPLCVVQDPTVPHHGRLTGGGGINGAAVDAGVQASYQDELTVGIESPARSAICLMVTATACSCGS